MPTPLLVLPDPIIALQQYLRLRPELLAITDAAHVVSAIPPAPDYTKPYVIVSLGGGQGLWPSVDEPAMQVDVEGADKALTSQVARVVRAAVWAIANDIVPAGCLCSGHEEMAPAWMPDTITVPPLARYVARYRVLLHP